MDNHTIVTPQNLIAIARKRWPKDSDLVKHTGLSRPTIWRIESGRFNFHDKTVGKLVKAINND